jgi:hypothetical protein
MPYITSVERLAQKESLLEGIEACLDIKFGTPGLQLLPEIRQIQDVEVLRAVLRAVRTEKTLDEVRRVWTP